MKILKQICLILGICLLGEMVVSFLPFSFPSSVVAIIILAVLLLGNILKEKQIKETADFLLSNMALVFVPLTVGMVEDLGILKGQVTGFLIVVISSLIITFLGTYGCVRIIQRCVLRFAKEGQSHE